MLMILCVIAKFILSDPFLVILGVNYELKLMDES